MTTPEVIKESPRSESAKKRWERERLKKSLQVGEMSHSSSTHPWIYHAEWLTLMVTVIGCFVFCFKEANRTNERLDAHTEAINRRADQLSIESNRRADELHKEFYDLLKETRRPAETHHAFNTYPRGDKT